MILKKGKRWDIAAIARLLGIYGNVNLPCPQAYPSGSGRFTAIYPYNRAITITYKLWFYAHLVRSPKLEVKANVAHAAVSLKQFL